MYYGIENFKDYLMHHGREGQKWGVRNGPPYPLAGKFADSVRKYKEHQSHKRRVKILNDPKKLYKHRSEFTEDEIRSATSKAQAVGELKRYVPEKNKKVKELANRKLALVDTPEKFKKNQKFLTEKEQQQAIDYLYKQDKAGEFSQNKKNRTAKTANDIMYALQNAGKTVRGGVDTLDKVMSLSPNYINMHSRQNVALLKKLAELPGDLGYKIAKGLGFNMGKSWQWERKKKETEAERDARERHERDKRNRDYAEAETMVRGIMLNRGINPDRKENRRYFQEQMKIYLNQNRNHP